MANKKRLIDANGSFTLTSFDYSNHSLCFGGGIITVVDALGRCICEFDVKDAPAAVTFEAVRCKDCEFFKDTWTSDDGKVYGYCPYLAWEHNENGYCHYGKEKQ